MSWTKLCILLALAACVGLVSGCDGDNGNGDGGTATGGSLAGTWSGRVCGRGLTMILNQSGTSLSGSYTLTDPVFSESLSGTASSADAPATATLNGGGDRHFEINFSSSSAMSGGFYKGATQVCSVSASK